MLCKLLSLARAANRSLDSVTRQEQSLNLFHALGKVLYNKRKSLLSSDADFQGWEIHRWRRRIRRC